MRAIWICGEHGHGKTTLARMLLPNAPLFEFFKTGSEAGLNELMTHHNRMILEDLPQKLTRAEITSLIRMVTRGHELVVVSHAIPKQKELLKHFTLITIQRH